MRPIKYIVLGAIAMVSVFCATLYTSCTKDACKTVVCLNGATCSGGLCDSCKLGSGGTQCEIVYRNLYSNVYVGNAVHNVSLVDTANALAFFPNDDSDLTAMKIYWTDTTDTVAAFPITLTSFSANGSSFTVPATKVDTVTYSGTGTVNANTVSLSLNEAHDHSPTVTVRLDNFVKK